MIEIKTTSAIKVKAMEGVYPYHITQLLLYMAILGASKGVLLYVIMDTAYLTDYFPEYHITMDESQRQRILKRIEVDVAELQDGINNKNPNLVGHILDNTTYMTKSKENWFCHSCPIKDCVTATIRDIN